MMKMKNMKCIENTHRCARCKCWMRKDSELVVCRACLLYYGREQLVKFGISRYDIIAAARDYGLVVNLSGQIISKKFYE